MADEKLEQAAEVVQQPESAGAKPPSLASDQKISLSLDELKSFMKSTVEEVLANSKSAEARQQIEEYNSKIAESVKASQASIIKPTLANGQKSVDYIKRVLDEDSRRRFQHGEGKALYSDKGEEFTKAKIVILKKMGLNEEEIAKELGDLI